MSARLEYRKKSREAHLKINSVYSAKFSLTRLGSEHVKLKVLDAALVPGVYFSIAGA